MLGRFRPPAGVAWLTPARVAASCVLVVAVSALSLGVLALALSGPEGALAAAQLPEAPDGPVHASGTVARVEVDGGTLSTRVSLVGAEGIDIQVAGTGAGPYGPGDYIEVQGAKQGTVVLASSVRTLTDPVDRAAPWLAAGTVLLAALLVGPVAAALRTRGTRAGHRSPLARMRSALPRRGRADEEGAPRPPAQ